MKILICIDFSAQTEKIFLAAKALLATRIPAPEITLLHVVEDVDAQNSNLLEKNRQQVNDLAQQYLDSDFFYMEEKGVLKDEINQALDNATYDLVVFGTKGRSALTNVLLGSTAQYLLHHLKVPMLVVP